MELKAEEISQIIKEQIADYDKKVELSETGVVLSVGDGIAQNLRARKRHGAGTGRISRRHPGTGSQS